MLLSAKTLKVDLLVDTDILSVTNYLFGGTVIRDRFNILNNLSNFQFALDRADPIPTASKKTFEEISDETASHLIQSSNGGKIGVLWSGGVDSTCVVSALIRNEVPKSQLEVIGTDEAIKESRYFFDFLKKNGYSVSITDNLPKTIGNLKDCAYLVSGAGGDQLCMHVIHRCDYSLYNLPWMEGVRGLCEFVNLPLSDRSLQYFEEIWKHYAKMFEVELRYFCEFVWVYNFAIRFDFVRDREWLMIADRENAKKYQPFFMGFDFQEWAVANSDKIKDYHQVLDRYHYKMPFKEYTYSVVKNRECFELGKHVSRPFPYEKITEIVLNTTEGVKIFRTPDNKYYEQAAQKIANLYRKVRSIC